MLKANPTSQGTVELLVNAYILGGGIVWLYGGSEDFHGL